MQFMWLFLFVSAGLLVQEGAFSHFSFDIVLFYLFIYTIVLMMHKTSAILSYHPNSSIF